MMSERPDDELEPAGEITSELLIEVFNEHTRAGNKAAEARGAIGSRLKGLAESHNLDLAAFRIAASLRKLPNGKREQRYRAVMHYCELLQVLQQQDIEDYINQQHQGADNRTDVEAAADGQPRARVNESYTPSSPMGKHALNTFKSGLDEAVDAEGVNVALENFATDHPKLADEALQIARNRLEAINREAGDGEDLRSNTAKQAEADRIAQSADTGKRQAREAKKTRTPRKANGADAEGAGSAAVH